MKPGIWILTISLFALAWLWSPFGPVVEVVLAAGAIVSLPERRLRLGNLLIANGVAIGIATSASFTLLRPIPGADFEIVFWT